MGFDPFGSKKSDKPIEIDLEPEEGNPPESPNSGKPQANQEDALSPFEIQKNLLYNP